MAENLQLLSNALAMLRDKLRAMHLDVTDAHVSLDTHDNQHEEKTYRVVVTTTGENAKTFEHESTTSHTATILQLISRI